MTSASRFVLVRAEYRDMSLDKRNLFQKLVTSFLLILIITGGSTGLKDVRAWVPAAVLRGDTAVLRCFFDLEGDSLYSVKWYKGGREFYRFTPKETPPMKIFPIHGFTVEKHSSNTTTLTLKRVSLTSSSKYSCEVSADAPSFQTALVTGEMDVVEVPKDRPTIIGLRHRYKMGDIIQSNCSSPWSKPAAKLTWIINGVQAPAGVVLHYPVEAEPGGDRERPTVGLRIRMSPEHLYGERLKIRCTASIHDIYWQIVEKSVEAERSRWQGGVQQPRPYTEQPPPGLRLDSSPLDGEGDNTPRSASSHCASFQVRRDMVTSALLCIAFTSRGIYSL